MPKLTVLMATCNRLPYLRECLSSLISQSFTDFEIIIVDDGSSDSTWNWLQGLADPRLRLIRHEKSLGLAFSLHEAFLLAKTPYIARMDDDDISEQDRFMEQVAYLDTHPDVEMVATRAFIINEEGAPVGREFETFRDPDLLRLYLVFENPICHPSVMMRRQWLLSLGGYQMQVINGCEHYGAEDYELWTRACCAPWFPNCIHTLDKALLRYRAHSKKLTGGGGGIEFNVASISRQYLKAISDGACIPSYSLASPAMSSTQAYKQGALLGELAVNLAWFCIPRSKRPKALMYLALKGRYCSRGRRQFIHLVHGLIFSRRSSVVGKIQFLVYLASAYRFNYDKRFELS